MKKMVNGRTKRPVLSILILISMLLLWGCNGDEKTVDPQGEEPATAVESPGSTETEKEQPPQEGLSDEELADLFEKGKELDEFYYEMKVSGLGDEDGVTKMYMKEGLMRIESEILGKSFMMIYSEDAFYTLDPESRTAIKISLGDEASEEREVITMDDIIKNFDDEHMTYVGKETVNGISCHVVESKERNSENQVKIWLHEEYGMPMRVESTTGSGKTHVMEVTDFNTDPLSEDLFKLPEGYKIIDLNNLIPTP